MKPQSDPFKLDPVTDQEMDGIPARLIHRGPEMYHQSNGSLHMAYVGVIYMRKQNAAASLESSLISKGGKRKKSETQRMPKLSKERQTWGTSGSAVTHYLRAFKCHLNLWFPSAYSHTVTVSNGKWKDSKPEVKRRNISCHRSEKKRLV
ncbi:hypothetical protein AVEN_127326-1 [Araneus ventricosus]|uniref:Uncharacterized protein n=1 Tax=Araneus ventricosus TaxID=182803 RepID=A0A4Y2H9P0_ARAVE|nr:hypothetical protein AVEN_127326-1 [Araneus ventricosus]